MANYRFTFEIAHECILQIKSIGELVNILNKEMPFFENLWIPCQYLGVYTWKDDVILQFSCPDCSESSEKMENFPKFILLLAERLEGVLNGILRIHGFPFLKALIFRQISKLESFNSMTDLSSIRVTSCVEEKEIAELGKRLLPYFNSLKDEKAVEALQRFLMFYGLIDFKNLETSVLQLAKCCEILSRLIGKQPEEIKNKLSCCRKALSRLSTELNNTSTFHLAARHSDFSPKQKEEGSKDFLPPWERYEKLEEYTKETLEIAVNVFDILSKNK